MTDETAQRPAAFGKVADLRPDSSGHNLVVKVLDAKVVLDRPAKAGLKPQKVAECTVGDETGVILMSARNEQVELLNPGSCLAIRNGKTEMFRSSMRLAVDKFGKIESAPDASVVPNVDMNMSLIEYELVQVPTAAKPRAPKPPAGPAGGEPAAAEAADDEAKAAEPAGAQPAAAEVPEGDVVAEAAVAEPPTKAAAEDLES